MKKFIVFICILLTSTLTGYIFAEELDQYNIVYPPYNCPTSSISCNLAGRGITKIADNAFQNHIILTNLNLASNELTGIVASAFNGLSGLLELNLSDNKFKKWGGLSAIDLSNLTSLEKLIIRGNWWNRTFLTGDIQQDQFWGLSGLKYLDIGDNRFSGIKAGAFNNLENLNYLNINGSFDDFTLPANIFSGLSNLTGLDIKDNGLAKINIGAFNGLNNLETLNLGYSRLGGNTLLRQGSFVGLNALKYLDLSNSNLNYNLDTNLFLGLDNLVSLDINSSNVMSISAYAFSGLNQLTSLNLTNNQISSIEANAFYGLSSLPSLSLAHNQISNLAANAFHGVENITSLNLSDNKITNINADAFNGLSNLTSLDLSNNQIPDFKTTILNGLYMLNSLNLAYNQISSISSNLFNGNINLENLRLDKNNITKISKDAFSGLTIKYLRLGSNQISYIESGALENLGLSSLYLENNQLSSLLNGVLATRIPDSLSVSNNQISYIDNEALPKAYMGPHVIDLKNNKIESFNWNIFSGDFNINSIYLSENPISNVISATIAGHPQLSLIEVNKTCTYNAVTLNYNSYSSVTDGNYCAIVTSATINNFVSTLIGKGYSGDSSLLIGTGTISFKEGITNKFLVKTIMQSTNQNSYSGNYYNNKVEVEYPSNTSITYSGSAYSGLIHSPYLFNNKYVDGLTGIIALTRFGSLNGRVDFNKDIKIRIPADGKNIGDRAYIYSSNSIDVFSPGAAKWTYEKTTNITNINGIPYVEFTGNHASRRVISDNEEGVPLVGEISYSITTPTYGPVVATITLNKEGSITNNGGSTSYTFTNNGSFTFTFADGSGNTGSATATVNNIDNTPPVGTISYSTTNPISGNVIATLTLNETGIVTNNGGSTSYTFTNNGSFTFTFVDLAGNTGSTTATVNNITAPDTTPPTATVSYSTTAPTNGSVIATITLSEAGSITNNGGSNSYTFADNGSFTFTFVDLAGNTGSVTATVNNITIIPIPTCYSISPGSGSEVTTNPLIFYRKCYDGSGITNTKIQIYNILGNLLYSQDIDTNYNSFSFTGDAGTYYRNIEATNISGNKSNMAKQAVIYNPPFTIEMINTGILYNNIYYINTGVVDINLYSNGSFYSLFSGEFVGNDSLTYNTKYRGKTLTFSGEGARIVTVKYFSAQQNGSLGPVTYYIDTTKPIISGLSPTSGSITTDSSIVLSWSGTDKNSGISSYDIQITSSSGIIVYYDTTTNTSISVSNLDLGTYHWGVVAKDMAGNTAYSSINQFTIRDTPATTPNNFAFTSIRDAFIEKKYLSNTFTVSGLGENTQSPISISNGSGTIIKNNTNIGVSGYVVNGDIIQLQLTASDEYNTTISSTLNIGDISATFSITTREDESNDCSLSNTEKYKIANMFELLKDSYKGTSNKWINMLYILQSMTEDIQDFDYNCSLGYLTNLVENEIEDGGDNSDNGDTEIDESAHTAPNCKEYSVEYNEDMNAYTSSDIKKTIYFASRDTLTKFIDSQNPGDCHINIYTDEQFEFEDTDEYHVAPNGKIYTIEEKDGYYLSPTMSNSRQFDTLESLTEYIDKYNPPFEIRDHEVDTDVDPIEYTAPNDKEYKIYKTDQGYMSYKFLKVKYFDSLEEIEAFIDKNNPKQ